MSKPLTVTIPHRLGRAEAKRRLTDGVARLQAQFAGQMSAVEHGWTGDRLDFKVSAMGQTVPGRIEVQDEAVRVDIELPWFLAALAEKVRKQVESHAGKMLENKP